MNEIVQNKMLREIMVVGNEKLFANFERETRFYSHLEHNFEEAILENYEYMERGIAEENTAFKQPIPYGVVINENNKVFVYKRGGAGSNAGESRLHSKIAFGVGGHIEREDEDSDNLLKDSLTREIEEEINISGDNIKSIDAIGYINADDDAVSEVHFGVAYIIKVDNDNFDLMDGELENGEFIDMESLEKMVESPEYEVENWSKILLEPLKEYINS